jgi:hypothetical protein
MVTHPYSIYIWQPPFSLRGEGHWFEPLQAYTQEYALYVANLIHQDSRSVIKVVRYGINIACFPDEHAVDLVERQIARQQDRAPDEHRKLVCDLSQFSSSCLTHNLSSDWLISLLLSLQAEEWNPAF